MWYEASQPRCVTEPLSLAEQKVDMPTLDKSKIASLLTALQPSVVDIGARGGLDEDLLAIAWACSVYGFEPEPAEAARLREKPDPRWKKVTILPYAVGGITGKATLYLPESQQGASLLRHNADMVDRFGFDNLHTVRKEISVDTVTLDGLFASGELPRADYLKIDIEGAELAVLKAGTSVLQRTSAVKVECSFLQQRVAQPLIWDLVPFMLEAGFEVVDIHDIHRWRRRPLPPHPYVIDFDMPYSHGQLAQCDLIFLRRPDTTPDLRQAAMLIVISAALGFFDFGVGVIRAMPAIKDQIQDDYGFDLESELARWAAVSGRANLRKAIRTQLRTLLPQLRSLVGRLPFRKPLKPY